MAARHEWALAACGLLVFLGINTAYTPPLSSSVVRLHRDVPHRRPLSQAPRYLRMRVSAASGMAPVQIVTTEGCKFCRKTKETFKSRGIEYEELSVAGDPMLLQKLAAVTGIKTVPQVFVDGRFVGDSETTLSILEEKSTQGLLSAGIDAKSLPTDTLDALREAHATYTTQTKMYDDVEPGTLKALYVQLEKALMTPDEPRPTLSPDMVRDALESLSEFQAQDASSSDIVRDLIANNWLGVVPGSDGKLLVLARSPPKPRRKGDPFNQEFEWSGDADHPGQISEQLQRGFTYLLDRHGKDGGRAVDYKALGEDPAFGEMVRLTHQLQKCDPSILSREERMAFFINIYNTLIVHAMVVRGPPKDFAARLLFYGEIKYVIGGEKYSCDDIENGVLRGNRASPASVGEILPFMKPKGPFKDGDGRIKQVINPPDARIHFALNCGAKSCPAIKVYTPAALLPGLQAAAEAFCSDPANVDFDQDTSTLKLSKIFQWYRGDFGSDEQLQGLLKEAVVGERGEELGRFFDSAGGKVNYEFVPYDWDLNEA